jgi:hypothetical protein
MYERQIRKPKEPQWRLAGSIKVKDGLDVDAAIEKGREKIRRSLKSRTKLL